MRFPIILFVWTLLFFSGCATPIPSSHKILSDAETYTVNGRFIVNYEKPDGAMGSLSANFDWQQHGLSTQITLRSSFGQILAQISIDQQGTLLKLPDHEPMTAKNGEALMRQQLGWSLPLKGLRYWLVGQAQPDYPSQSYRDSKNFLERIVQNGWQIDYLAWEVNLPKRINLIWLANHPQFELRLVLNSWE